MKYSLTAALFAPQTFPVLLRGDMYDNVKKAAELRYDAIEIHIQEPECIDACKLNEWCIENGIAISSIGTGMGYVLDGLSLTDNDNEVRSAAVDRIKNMIGLGGLLKSPVIIGSMRGKYCAVDDCRKYKAHLTESLLELMDCAEGKDVMIVLEVINRYETNFLNNISQACDYIKSIGSGKLKIHIDTFHMNIEEGNITDSIYACGELLGHVHFADSDRWYPGHGHMDFKGIIKALEDIGYNGYAALECLPYPEPYTAAETGLKYLKGLQ